MKYRHIAAGLITLSLVAVTVMATATAAEYIASYFGSPLKVGHDFTIIIDTSDATTIDGSSTIEYFGNSVDRTSIVVTIYDMKNNPVYIYPTPDRITLSGDSVVIHLVKQDGLPIRSSATNVRGNLLEPYAGNTFYASGPGWGWGAHF